MINSSMQFLKRKMVIPTIHAGGGRDGGRFRGKSDLHGETELRSLHKGFTENGGTSQALKVASVNAFLQKGRRGRD